MSGGWGVGPLLGPALPHLSPLPLSGLQICKRVTVSPRTGTTANAQLMFGGLNTYKHASLLIWLPPIKPLPGLETKKASLIS